MKSYLMVALAALSPTYAVAFDVTGGEAELSYSFLTEESDLNRTDLGGSVEVGFTQNIGVQLDLGFADFGASDLSVTTIGLHGIYHASDATSVGVFLSRDRGSVDGASDSQNVLGVEVGYEGPAFDLAAHYGAVDTDAGNGAIAGLSGSRDFSDTLSAGIAIDYLDAGDVSLTSLTLRGNYALTPGTQLFAEVGHTSIDVGTVEEGSPTIGLGATFKFGADRGATFDRRSILGSIPGL